MATFLVALLLGAAITGPQDVDDVKRAAFADGQRSGEADGRAAAEGRYEDGQRDGLAEGRAEFRRGSTAYKRIWRRGYREAKRTIEAAPAQPVGTGYDAGHVDGCNEGCEEGYDHGSAGRPFDDSDNDTPGTVGDDDAEASAAGDATGNCDPNYSGACVPADRGDVNCADVPGTDVEVVGEDVYGLDGNGDGLACES